MKGNSEEWKEREEGTKVNKEREKQGQRRVRAGR
jgi:hypothetical protein